MRTWLELLTWGRLRSTVFVLYALGIAGLAGGYIAVSTQEVASSAYIRGERMLAPGRPRAIRGGVLNAQTGQFRRRTEVDFRLTTSGVAGSDSVRLARLSPGPGGTFSTTFVPPPDSTPGSATLSMSATGPSMPEFEARTEITVGGGDSQRGAAYWPSETSRIEEDERRERLDEGPVVESSGEVRVDVLPPDGEVVRGLPSRIYVRTVLRENGRPVGCDVRFARVTGSGTFGSSEGLPASVETSTLGLAAVEVGLSGGQRWRLVAEACEGVEVGDAETAGRSTVRVHTVPAQFDVEVTDPLVSAGGRIEGEVEKLIPSDSLFVDLYAGPAWARAGRATLEGRSGTVGIRVPEQTSAQIFRIQIHGALFDPGRAWDVDYAVRVEGENERIRLVRAVERAVEVLAERRDSPYYTYLRDHPDAIGLQRRSTAQLERLLDGLLEAFPRHFDAGEVLLNTQERDRQTLREWKRRKQSDLMYLLVAALVGVLAMIGYAVVAGIGESRELARRLHEIDDDLANESDSEPVWSRLGIRERVAIGLMGLVVFTTIVLFGAGLILVLTLL